jgi:hypothetical protein
MNRKLRISLKKGESFEGSVPLAGGLSFVDGHAEIKRGLDPRTTPPIHQGSVFIGGASPNNRDFVWLQDRATRMKR